jgi:CRP/FNR family transcriptional regulator, cyclic AMP receptor protein
LEIVEILFKNSYYGSSIELRSILKRPLFFAGYCNFNHGGFLEMNPLNFLIRRAHRKALRAMSGNENYRFLRNCYLFSNIADDSLLFIIQRILVRRYSQDELVFKQDNPGICLFIVKKGSVEIYLRRADKEKVALRVVKEGGVFGEISLLSSTSRMATAKTLENDTVLLTLSYLDLKEIDTQFPQASLKILRNIMDTIVANLEETNRRLRMQDIEIQELKRKLAKHES